MTVLSLNGANAPLNCLIYCSLALKFKISVSQKSVLGTDKNITCPNIRINQAKPTVPTTKKKLMTRKSLMLPQNVIMNVIKFLRLF